MREVQVLQATKTAPNSRGRNSNYAVQIDRIRVAAYCRVSTDGDEQLGSFEFTQDRSIRTASLVYGWIMRMDTWLNYSACSQRSTSLAIRSEYSGSVIPASARSTTGASLQRLSSR